MTLTFLDGDVKIQIAWSRRRGFQNLETRRLTANASGRETTPSPRWTLSASSPPVWTTRSSLTLPSWRRSMTPRPGSTLASSTNARCNFISAFSTEKFQRPNAQGFKGERTPLPFLGVGPLQVHLQHPLPSRWNFWFSEKLAGRFYTPAMLFASNDESSVMIDIIQGVCGRHWVFVGSSTSSFPSRVCSDHARRSRANKVFFLQHNCLVIDILYRIVRDIGLDDGQVFVDYYDWSNDRCIKIE